MNNQQIIETLVKKLSRTIEWRMEDFKESYAEAKDYAKEKSVAGPAVWDVLDKKYKDR